MYVDRALSPQWAAHSIGASSFAGGLRKITASILARRDVSLVVRPVPTVVFASVRDSGENAEVMMDEILHSSDICGKIAPFFTFECLEKGDRNLGLIERIVGTICRIAVRNRGVANLLRSFLPAVGVLFGDVVANSRLPYSDIARSYFNSATAKRIEDSSYAKQLMDECALFLRCFFAQQCRRGAPLAIVFHRLQFADPYSVRVLARMAEFLACCDVLMLCFGPERVLRGLEKHEFKRLQENGYVAFLNVDSNEAAIERDRSILARLGGIHLSTMESRSVLTALLSQLDPDVRTCLELLSFANVLLSRVDLLKGLEYLTGRNVKNAPKVSAFLAHLLDDEPQLRVDWRTVLRDSCIDKQAIHKAHIHLLSSEYKSQSIPRAATFYHLTKLSDASSVITLSTQYGFLLYEKVRDLQGAAQFYEQCLGCATGSEAAKVEIRSRSLYVRQLLSDTSATEAAFKASLESIAPPFDRTIWMCQWAVFLCNSKQDLQSAQFAIEQAKRCTYKIVDKHMRKYAFAKTLSSEALIAYRRKELDHAFNLLQLANKTLRSKHMAMSAKLFRYRVLLNTAHLLAANSATQVSAIKYGKMAYKLARRLGEREKALWAAQSIARLHAKMGNESSAERWFKVAVSTRISDFPLPSMRVSKFAISTYWTYGKFPAVDRWTARMVRLYRKNRRFIDSVLLPMQSALHYYKLKKYKEAYNSLLICRHLLDSPPHLSVPRLRFAVSTSLALTAMMLRDCSAARVYALEARRLITPAGVEIRESLALDRLLTLLMPLEEIHVPRNV